MPLPHPRQRPHSRAHAAHPRRRSSRRRPSTRPAWPASTPTWPPSGHGARGSSSGGSRRVHIPRITAGCSRCVRQACRAAPACRGPGGGQRRKQMQAAGCRQRGSLRATTPRRIVWLQGEEVLVAAVPAFDGSGPLPPCHPTEVQCQEQSVWLRFDLPPEVKGERIRFSDHDEYSPWGMPDDWNGLHTRMVGACPPPPSPHPRSPRPAPLLGRLGDRDDSRGVRCLSRSIPSKGACAC
jgi:hypothetical protein